VLRLYCYTRVRILQEVSDTAQVCCYICVRILQKYLERNAVLARVPPGFRLYIIAKPFGEGNGRRYSYYLQDRADERDVTPFKNLHELASGATRRMLAYAGVCWRMLAHADVC
jgi:hypothetical protein